MPAKDQERTQITLAQELTQPALEELKPQMQQVAGISREEVCKANATFGKKNQLQEVTQTNFELGLEHLGEK